MTLISVCPPASGGALALGPSSRIASSTAPDRAYSTAARSMRVSNRGEREYASGARDPLRPQRRRQHCLPGGWRRALRPRLRPRLGLAYGARVESPGVGGVLPAPGLVLASDCLR